MHKALTAGLTAVVLLLGGYTLTRDTGIGPIGPQGPQGPAGESIAGPQGPAGKDGRAVTYGAVSSSEIYTDYLCVNNSCTKYLRGSFRDATTTLAAVRNPWNATSTVTFTQLAGINGTTTNTFVVATSTAAGATAGATMAGNFSCQIATSTSFTAVAGATTDGSTLARLVSCTTVAANGFLVGPSEYVIIQASSTYASIGADNNAITNVVNTLSGTYELQFKKN